VEPLAAPYYSWARRFLNQLAQTTGTLNLSRVVRGTMCSTAPRDAMDRDLPVYASGWCSPVAGSQLSVSVPSPSCGPEAAVNTLSSSSPRQLGRTATADCILLDAFVMGLRVVQLSSVPRCNSARLSLVHRAFGLPIADRFSTMDVLRGWTGLERGCRLR